MKKKIILSAIIVLLMSLGIMACGGNVDTKSPAKIVITVDSALPQSDITVTSSRGEFKQNGNVYTLDLDNRNLTVISVSADSFKTLSMEVKASDYVDGVYSKTVNFEEKLGTSVEISIKSLPIEAEIACDNEKYTVTKTGNNKYMLYMPMRGTEAECNVTLSAEGYETRVYNLTEKVLSSGYYNASTLLIKTGYKMIELIGDVGESFIIGRNFDIYSASYDNSTNLTTYTVKDNDVILIDSNSPYKKCIYTKDLPIYGTVFDFNQGNDKEKSYVLVDEQFSNLSPKFIFKDGVWENCIVEVIGYVDKVTGQLKIHGYFPEAGTYAIVTDEDNNYYAREFTIEDENFDNPSFTLSYPKEKRLLSFAVDYADYNTGLSFDFPPEITQDWEKINWLRNNDYSLNGKNYRLEDDTYTVVNVYSKDCSLTLKFDMEKSAIDDLNKLHSSKTSIVSTTADTVTISNFSLSGNDEPFISFDLIYSLSTANQSIDLARETYNIKLSDENLNKNSHEWTYEVPLVFHGYSEFYSMGDNFNKSKIIDALDDMPAELKNLFQNASQGENNRGSFGVNAIQIISLDSTAVKKVGYITFVRYDAKFTLNLVGHYYADLIDKAYQGNFSVKSVKEYTYTELIETSTYNEQWNSWEFNIDLVKVSHKFSYWSTSGKY